MTEREKEWADYQAWKKDFTGPIYFQNWDQWIAEFGFASWQASLCAALEEAVRVTAQSQTTSHACDAIRALATGAKNG